MTVTDGRTGAADQAAEVGRARLRKEDHRLIIGRSRYTDNLSV